MDLLYHYTTVDALIGMTANMSVNNKDLTMWATDIICMNDPMEKKIGIDLIDSHLEEIEEVLNIPNERRVTLLRNIDENFRNALLNEDTDTEQLNYNIYVTSFSQSEDSLPMWSMYGKNGNGISLGFDLESIHKNFKTGPFFFGKIIYDNITNNEINPILKSSYKLAYEKTIGSMENFKTKLDKEQFNKTLSLAVYRYYTLIVASLIKHHSYEYENEFRVCFIKDSLIKFRSSNGFIVPYIDYKLPIDFLKKIIIGPTLDYERILSPLSKLFRSKGINISKIEVEKTKVPYRE